MKGAPAALINQEFRVHGRPCTLRYRYGKQIAGDIVTARFGYGWNAVPAQQARAGRHVAIYWDGSIRLEVGVELYGPFAEEGEVVRSATPAGPVAWATHLGPYNSLGATHDAIRQWCRANNRLLAGPNWEIYGHWQSESNANPSQIRTDVAAIQVTTSIS